MEHIIFPAVPEAIQTAGFRFFLDFLTRQDQYGWKNFFT